MLNLYARIISTILLVIFLTMASNGQSVAINNTGELPHSSAILDVSADSLGMLIPRLTSNARIEIVNPAEGLLVYQTDEQKGLYFYRANEWNMFAQQAYDHIPLGGILDWIPYDQSLPEGFVQCDGSLITDPSSPYFNESLPDLQGKYIKAVALENIDTTGGSSTHRHGVNFPNYNTTNANVTHEHTAAQLNVLTSSEPHSHQLTFPSVSSETHNHEWAKLNDNENWRSFDGNGDGIEMVNWSDGMDAAGSGHYPFAVHSPGGLDHTEYFYTNNRTHTHFGASTIDLYTRYHNHTLIVSGVGENENAVHHHNVAIPYTYSTTVTHIPPSIKMLKIMRIK